MILESLLAYSVWLTSTFLGSLAILAFGLIVKTKWLEILTPFLAQSRKIAFILPVPLLILWYQRGALFPIPQPHESAFIIAYFSQTFLLARLVCDFLLWGLLAWIFGATKRVKSAFGPIGLIVVLLTGTQFAVDWVMALSPQWKSTGFGLVFLMSSLLLAFALSLFKKIRPVERSKMQDLGNVHFATIATWSYVTFMQFLVIWSGNLPSEAPWYTARLQTDWKYVVLAIVMIQFVLPLFSLLMRPLKSSAVAMRAIALCSIFGQSAFSFVSIEASLHPAGIRNMWSLVIFSFLVAVTVTLFPDGPSHEKA